MRTANPEYHRNDSRGSLTQIVSGDWKQINLLEIKAGETFGGHYHKEKTEYFYVISGTVKVEISNAKTGKEFVNGMIESEAFIVEPYDKHTLTGITNCTVLELLSVPYNKEDCFE